MTVMYGQAPRSGSTKSVSNELYSDAVVYLRIVAVGVIDGLVRIACVVRDLGESCAASEDAGIEQHENGEETDGTRHEATPKLKRG
jgi:hypothetical protein